MGKKIGRQRPRQVVPTDSPAKKPEESFVINSI